MTVCVSRPLRVDRLKVHRQVGDLDVPLDLHATLNGCISRPPASASSSARERVAMMFGGAPKRPPPARVANGTSNVTMGSLKWRSVTKP
eukprot:1019433-Prymnesium_polylepis.1